MSEKPTSKRSARHKPARGRANLARLRRLSEAEIRRTAPPELTELPADFWEEAVPVVPEPKVPISLRVDRDVLEWFRASGAKYQSRMNAVLRSYVESTKRSLARKGSRRGTA